MALGTSKMFDNYKQQILNKNQNQDENKSKSYADDRFISFVPDKSFRFRLLFYIDDTSKRKTPFIEQYIHAFYDKDTRSREVVICPTSEYIKGNFGFNQCSVCNNNKKLWKELSTGNKTSKELYDQVKRKFHGYALVYVVNDGANPENNGKVKLMHYGKDIKKFFKQEIIGDENSVDPVGSSAFSLESGYDLLISVALIKDPNSDDSYKEYTCKFAREKSAINIDVEKLEAEIKALNFDKDYYKITPTEQINEFFQKFVLEKITEDEEKHEPAELDDMYQPQVKTNTPEKAEKVPAEKVEKIEKPEKVEKAKPIATNNKVEKIDKIDELTSSMTLVNKDVSKESKNVGDDFDLDAILKDIDSK